MNIKNLIDRLNSDNQGEFSGTTSGKESPVEGSIEAKPGSGTAEDEKVIYIENPRIETEPSYTSGNELLIGSTKWSDRALGDILVSLGCLNEHQVEAVVDLQRKEGIYFGEAALKLDVIGQEDLMKALAVQFGYSCGSEEDGAPAPDKVMAYSPFSEQAEEFRSIRGQLLHSWLTQDRKVLAVVSPTDGDGKSYVAANLAMAFAQLGQPTMLIDADLRKPRQHKIFDIKTRTGLSTLLAGRIKIEDLEALPNQVPNFQNLSVLSCGALPPNPAELLSRDSLHKIVSELKSYFSVIIIDTPSSTYQADIMSIATVAKSAMLVTRGGYTRMEHVKELKELLLKAGAGLTGAILNQY